MTVERVIEIVRATWGLLRGNIHYRFAALMVRSGVALVLGPPAVVVLIETLFEITMAMRDDWVGATVALAPVIVGVAMIVFGVRLFFSRPPDQPVAGPVHMIGMTLSGRETFEFAAKLALLGEKKGLIFEGFTDADLAQRMERGEVEATTTAAMLAMLRGKVRSANDFPAYDVVQTDELVTLRRCK